MLRGWTNYFRHGVSAATFGYLRAYAWARVVNWLRRKHPKANWKQLRRRYLPGWWPRVTTGSSTPPRSRSSTAATGAKSPAPPCGQRDQQHDQPGTNLWRAGCGDDSHVRFGGRAEETDRLKGPHRASARPNHTCATMALQAGVPTRVVSEWLGHASTSITEDIYQHVIPSMMEEAGALVTNLVLGDESR